MKKQQTKLIDKSLDIIENIEKIIPPFVRYVEEIGARENRLNVNNININAIERLITPSYTKDNKPCFMKIEYELLQDYIVLRRI